MSGADLDDLLRHAAAHGEAVLFVPAKLVPLPGEHRRPVFELVQSPKVGEPMPAIRELDT